MAKIANPRKVFNFVVEIEGLDQFEVQEVKIPEIEVEAVVHGGPNNDVKTAGRVSIGDIEMKKLRAKLGSDSWAMDWLRAGQDILTGGGGLASQYKRTLIIKELAADGVITMNRWICTGCWVKKIALDGFNRTGSDNTMEAVTICVDTIRLL